MTATTLTKTLLTCALEHERTRGGDTYMTQPTGGGEVVTLTWKEALDQARRIAAYLREQDLPEGSHIAIFSKNTAYWVIADLAIWMAGHVSIPIYPTLTPDTIGQILEHSETRLVFIGKLDTWEASKPGIPTDMAKVRMPLGPADGGVAWEEILGKTEPLKELAEPGPDSLATIIYTSGSTGKPKGVMHKFSSMVSAAAAVTTQLSVTKDDRMLSYLPLAHALERWIVESGSLLMGFQLFFAESLDTFVIDLKRARPTLFASVPRLWLKFQQGVFKKMPEKRLALLLKIPFVKTKVRKKILSGLGLDDCRFAGSGSAPIPASVIDWYRSLGLELLEAYGMSENFCYSHCAKPGRVRVGTVGEPYPGVEVRFSDEGEILVKSPGTMAGYYKEPELTAESFTEDGFLKTGDLGHADELGRLTITGRLKELFKTSKGKYVAPVPIENKLMERSDIEIACVTGSGLPQPIALLVLAEDLRPEQDKAEVRTRLTAELTAALKALNAGLDHHEQLGALVIVKEAWQIENGFLTPTMKIKRAKVEQAFKDRYEGWAQEKKPVIWE